MDAKSFRGPSGVRWYRFGYDSVTHGCFVYRRWRATNTGNGLQYMVRGSDWADDGLRREPYDSECRLALRALVGPPPWETEQAAAPPQCAPLEATRLAVAEALRTATASTERALADLDALREAMVEADAITSALKREFARHP